MGFNNGGQEVIKRLLQAYGLTTRKALCDQLGVSTSTMSTRWMRDIFPADWVIQCAIETKASLEWLSFGVGEICPKENNTTPTGQSDSANDNALNDVVAVARKKLVDGNLYDSNFVLLDKAIIPRSIHSPIVILTEGQLYLADSRFDEVTDGTWIVEIEGKTSIRDLIRIPVGKVMVKAKKTEYSFECMLDDIKPIAKCHYYLLADVQ